MLVLSDSYKYCSWDSKWLLTWLTCAFPSSILFAGKGSKNYGISLIDPNSHKNRIRVGIGAKNKQTEVERREKVHSRVTEALWEVYYARIPTCSILYSHGSRWVGSDGLERSGLLRFCSHAERQIGLGLT